MLGRSVCIMQCKVWDSRKYVHVSGQCSSMWHQVDINMNAREEVLVNDKCFHKKY